MENSKTQLSFFKKPMFQSIAGIVVILGLLGVFIYWRSVSPFIAIDMSQVSAPMIGIGPEQAGILSDVFVKPGDNVTAGEPLARVGSETLFAVIPGIVVNVSNTPGQVFSAGSKVVTMIDPNELRIVGKIDEDKGLSNIKIGDKAIFTLDAFGSTQFTGVVDEVSPTSNESSIVFNISDKREIKQFDVKVKFDTAMHPEFKNGMSAKLKIYVK